MIAMRLTALLVVLGLSLNRVSGTWQEVNSFLVSQNPDDLSFSTKLAMKLYFENLKSTTSPNCCQIIPPNEPVYDGSGHLTGYRPTACPAQYVICCKGYINILGTCISLIYANELLPQWQHTAETLGISLAEAIQQSGILIG